MHKKLSYILSVGVALACITTGKIYADAQIVIDPVTQTISVIESTGSTNTGNISVVTTGTSNTGTTVTPTTGTTVTNTPSRTSDTKKSEFENALSRLYYSKITKYQTTGDYRMYDSLTREEAAKMMVQTYSSLGFSQSIKNTNCTFNDASTFNPELKDYITKACQRGLMKGSNGLFNPKKALTRPESMTILVRMFEGQNSNEAKDPRWSEYYIKGKALGLTSLTNSGFDQSISRYEIALYIYRFQSITNDAALKLKSQSILANLNLGNNTNTGTIVNTGDEASELAQKFAAIASSISVENDPELTEAIRWMNDKGLTNFTTIATYKPFEVLLREQAAKIFDVFAKTFKFSQDKLNTTNTACTFTDLKNTDSALALNIQNVCKMGALAGGNGLFNPKGTLTKGQFITALIRLLEGKKLDESKNPRWTNYYQTALNMGIVGPADALTFDSPITRYEVALFLYRFKVKYQLVNSLNSTGVDNLIISTVESSILYQTGTNASGATTKTFKSANIFIDTNLLQNGNFEIGYIDFLGNTYKVVKSSTETYFNKNFVRYGDVYDVSSDSKIGTINFVVSNKYVLEGTLRVNNDSYNITPLSDTSIYYTVKKI